MKIALAQQNYRIGDFVGNQSKILKAIHQAKEAEADLVIFPELAVCGYPPRDFLEFSEFIESCKSVLNAVCEASRETGVGVLLGCPSGNPVPEGKDLFNSAFLIDGGKIIHRSDKALLPTYDIFDEYRYFEPAQSFNVAEFRGRRLAITICEDIWNIGNENPLYTNCPLDELIQQNPEVILNLSASPFDFEHAEERLAIVKENCLQYKLPMFYCNSVGAHTEVIFDGGSLVADAKGNIIRELPYFQDCLEVFDLETLEHLKPKVQQKVKIPLIYNALVMGIQDYFQKLGFKKAILGLSGGIDSALTLVLAAKALGPSNVLPVMMPSQFSSEHSLSDSEALCQNLNCPSLKIGIKEVYNAVLDKLQPHFEGKSFDVTEENIQARVRGLYLMALSNKLGGIVLNTTNKSEAAVGYGTLYGDLCGGLSVLGDVYKTEVYEMAGWINRDEEIIPKHIIEKAPSAELRPNQKDSDSLPEYDLLDQILYQYIEERQGPKAIISQGFEESVVRRVLKLVNQSEYKRYQTAPMLRVSKKSFGMGRRMPIVAKYLQN